MQDIRWSYLQDSSRRRNISTRSWWIWRCDHHEIHDSKWRWHPGVDSCERHEWILINDASSTAGPNTAVVTIRNLSIFGLGGPGTATASPGVVGIRVLSANAVIVDRVTISGFVTAGIQTVSPTPANVTVINSTITNNIQPSNLGASTGMGIHGASGSITVENSLLSHNGIAVQVEPAGTVRLSNNGVYNNKTGFFCNGGGTFASSGNNRKGNNTGGSLTPCAPTATITVQ